MIKKTIGFLAGLTIVVLVTIALFTATRLYDYARAGHVDSILLSGADSHRDGAIEAPIPLNILSDDYVRDQLIKKFAIEYLQVLPVMDELADRSAQRGILRIMLAPPAFAQWRRDVLPELEKMASARKRRTINVLGISRHGDYYVVPFQTKDWDTPNRLSAIPTITSGQELYLKIRFNKKVRDTMNGSSFDAGKWLDNERPPAAIFEFIVDEVIIR